MIDLRAHIRRLTTMVASSIVRGVISRVDDDTKTQLLQIELREGEVADRVEHFQPFGLSFNPPDDSEVVVLAAGGSYDNLVALNATHRSSRPRGAASGEGGLYTPSGWKVFLDKNDRTNLGAKQASQSFVRGEDIKKAIDDYASAVTQAVGQITYTGTGSVNPSTATAALQKAASSLSSAVQQALSDKVKGE